MYILHKIKEKKKFSLIADELFFRSSLAIPVEILEHEMFEEFFFVFRR